MVRKPSTAGAPGEVRAEPPPSPGKRGPGRPPIHAEEWTKVTVVLFNRQIGFLDGLAGNIRAHSGTAVSRAQLIRALIDAVAEGKVDLTSARSEADIKMRVLSRLAVVV